MSNRYALPLTRNSAGNYSAEYKGYTINVVDEVTAYGDAGWNAYVSRAHADGYYEDGIVTDYPYKTRAVALAVAIEAVDHRVSSLRRRLYAAALQEVSY